MTTRIFRLLPFLALGLAAVAIALATLVEASQGTAVAHQVVYGAGWFRLLWLVAAASGLYLIIKRHLWRRSMGVFCMHLSLLVILLGALVTSLTSHRGMLRLRQGEPVSQYLEGTTLRPLPFTVRLDTFMVQCYPGTQAPQDYVSLVTLLPAGGQVRISMNRIGRLRGYRLYQSSYDEDLRGSILSVTYDPWGTAITYCGYALLALCIIATSLPSWRRRGRRAALWLLLALPGTASHAASQLPCIGREQADRMEREQVVWNGRVAPMGTMCQEFLLKVYGRRQYHGLTATQVVCSMTLRPQEWAGEPLIRVGRGEYRTMASFVDYRSMPPRLKDIDGADSKVREKVGLMLMLMQGTLFTDVPGQGHRLSQARVSAELLYNRYDWTMLCMATALLLALLLALSTRPRLQWCGLPAGMLHGALALLLTLLMGLRWYIAGHIPLSNGYETMLFVSLCLTCGTLPAARLRLRATGALATACMMMVAHLGEINPQITSLMPVLHSPWLSAHVSIIMVSYALLALSMVERSLLRPAVLCLAAGIFLGAVWANVSWGTYWSWDPKESWALVCLIVYSIPLHRESLPWFRKDSHYRIYSLLCLACLLMTYFGVNYLLPGMHSYAG
mgnify:FL=1